MFKLRIETQNEAFDENPELEIVRILNEVILKLEQGTEQARMLDVNGNLVGNYTLTKR